MIAQNYGARRLSPFPFNHYPMTVSSIQIYVPAKKTIVTDPDVVVAREETVTIAEEIVTYT